MPSNRKRRLLFSIVNEKCENNNNKIAVAVAKAINVVHAVGVDANVHFLSANWLVNNGNTIYIQYRTLMGFNKYVINVFNYVAA